MSPSRTETTPELIATCVRAFMLYSLAEFQSGNATTIQVTARGSEFSISDNGRGHPLDKSLEGVPYLHFIYTHFGYPFGLEQGATVQLQGIGMSLINALCAALQLEVRKRSETLRVTFENGKLCESQRTDTHNDETGITVVGKIRPELLRPEVKTSEVEAWLQGVLRAHPSLLLSFNGLQLSVAPPGDA